MAESLVNLNLNNTNIRQVTNYDVTDSLSPNPSNPERANKISVDTEPTYIQTHGLTQESRRTVEVYYATLNLESTIKMGYSCDETVKKLPIFIKFVGVQEEREFYVGRTGMLEIQPETQKNVNGTDYDDLNGRVYQVQIEYIRVPYKYRIL